MFINPRHTFRIVSTGDFFNRFFIFLIMCLHIQYLYIQEYIKTTGGNIKIYKYKYKIRYGLKEIKVIFEYYTIGEQTCHF